MADTTCASSFSNLKGHNVEPTKGQRLSLATTSPDSSGQDVEHTLAGQRLSLSTTSPNLSGHVEHTPVGQSSSLAAEFYTDIFRDSQAKPPVTPQSVTHHKLKASSDKGQCAESHGPVNVIGLY